MPFKKKNDSFSMLYLKLSSIKNYVQKRWGILSIYGYSRVITSNHDYKTRIQKLEQTGTKKRMKELEELLSNIKTDVKNFSKEVPCLTHPLSVLPKSRSIQKIYTSFFIWH